MRYSLDCESGILPLLRYVSLLTLQLLTQYCDNCIQDRCKISFHLCDTQLVEGEISFPMLPLHDFENMVKMFTFSLLRLHKTTSNTAVNVYSLSKKPVPF